MKIDFRILSRGVIGYKLCSAVLLSFTQQCGHYKGIKNICKSLKVFTSLHPIEFNDIKRCLKISISVKMEQDIYYSIPGKPRKLEGFWEIICFELQYFIVQSEIGIARLLKVF